MEHRLGGLVVPEQVAGLREIVGRRWERGKCFEIEPGRRLYICRSRPWHTKIEGQWREIDFMASATSYTGDDGKVYGRNAVYATARSTSNTCATNDQTLPVGQILDGDCYVYRSYVRFDTSGMDEVDDEIESAFLYLKCQGKDVGGGNFDIECCKWIWSAPLCDATEANYDGALESSVKDMTWKNTADIAAGNWYNTPVTDLEWVNAVGNTYYVLLSSEDVADSAPTGFERAELWADDSADDPYLSITTHARGGLLIL